MILTKYDVTLKKLTEDKIELVREWRNHPKVSRFMEYREHITQAMQKKWFENIDNNNNLFFIIEVASKEIGLINIKDIDYQQKKGEAGIFIFDDDFLNGLASFQSCMCMYDYFFEDLNMESLSAYILKENKRAIKFNQTFGFQLDKNQMNKENQLYYLHKEKYLQERERIKSILY